jgi:hypothetical protein
MKKTGKKLRALSLKKETLKTIYGAELYYIAPIKVGPAPAPAPAPNPLTYDPLICGSATRQSLILGMCPGGSEFCW